jgi:hypothetical protein
MVTFSQLAHFSLYQGILFASTTTTPLKEMSTVAGCID